MTRILVVLLAAISACGCGRLSHLENGVNRVQNVIAGIECRDGLPAKILSDPSCIQGICGVTCEPMRWYAPPKDQE
jgi:hypothetical protein